MSRSPGMIALAMLAGGLLAVAQAGPATGAPIDVDVVEVRSQVLETSFKLPGELQPYQSVEVYARVAGFVATIDVDRGSHVQAGQRLARVEAPELDAQQAEATARVQSALAAEAEAAAKVANSDAIRQRLEKAARTPGVVSGNDLDVARRTVEAERARHRALGASVAAARASLRAVESWTSYLDVKAPFEGVITERMVHPGALVGPTGPTAAPLARLEQQSRLRLVVAVPEKKSEAVTAGTTVSFSVESQPAVTFQGIIARSGRSIDPKSRTMPVEVDVDNASGQLAPGLFATVTWPSRRSHATRLVPRAAVVNAMEGTYVLAVRSGRIERVRVVTGDATRDDVEVFGDLKDPELVVVRGTEELRPGTAVEARRLRDE